MEKTVNIIDVIENFAPVEYSQKWDNSGWQINLNRQFTNKILLTLDVTSFIVKEAIKQHCDMIISHHPVFFNPIKKIDSPFIIDAIQNNIQIYSSHTNLDIVKNGVCDCFAEKCGFTNLNSTLDFIRYKFLDKDYDFSELLLHLKKAFGLKFLKIVNNKRKTYNSIAFCSGSGSEFIEDLVKMGIDVFITGDLKHHQALNADSMTIIDVGHYHSEKFVVEIFEQILKNKDVELLSKIDEEPWEFV